MKLSKKIEYLLIITVIMLMSVTGTYGAQVKPESEKNRTNSQVIIFNRPVADFRAPFLGVSTEERAERARIVLEKLLAKGGKGTVTLQNVPQGYAVMVDGVLAFFIVPEDVNPLNQETLEQYAGKIAQNLELVLRETAESQNFSHMVRATGLALAATLFLCVTALTLHRIRTSIVTRLAGVANKYSEKLSLGGESLFHSDKIILLVRYVISFCYWIIIALMMFNWTVYVLARFPYTRPWGEQLTNYLLGIAGSLGEAILKAIPGLFVSCLIFIGAKQLINLLNAIFNRIARDGIEIAGLDRDTIRPTKRLVAAGIWLFAVAMAYPYLPGAQTDAFKGLSVLVGLMVSLGGSSLVGQAASGLILMYTRTLRAGEYVQIAGTEGTVMELGLFATRVRTGLGEELTFPNALILANVTRNYSRTVKGPGYILDTTVTIGYDTPWRQVHAMLLEAARQTSGVLTNPPPQVFQTALSDFYPQYRLVCQAIPAEPRPRAEVMNAIHANIQDVFNKYGVQIMSPHYIADPVDPKWVPKEKWFSPPAGENH